MGIKAEQDEAWDQFLGIWEELLETGDEPRTIVVVEGERDRDALRKLGVEGRIVPLHQGRRITAVARELSELADRVVLLTDWDEEGGLFAQRFRELLEPGDASVDLDLRRRLARCVRGELVHVEGLFGWARRNAERHGATLEHFRPDWTRRTDLWADDV